jgi:hypothetical protein
MWYYYIKHFNNKRKCVFFLLPLLLLLFANMRGVLVTKFFTWFDIILRARCSQQVETPYRKNFHVPFALGPVDRRLNDLLWPQTERAPQNVNDGGKLFFTLGRPRGWGKKMYPHTQTHIHIQNLYIHFYTQILMGKCTTVSFL